MLSFAVFEHIFLKFFKRSRATFWGLAGHIWPAGHRLGTTGIQYPVFVCRPAALQFRINRSLDLAEALHSSKQSVPASYRGFSVRCCWITCRSNDILFPATFNLFGTLSNVSTRESISSFGPSACNVNCLLCGLMFGRGNHVRPEVHWNCLSHVMRTFLTSLSSSLILFLFFQIGNT